MVMNTNYGMWMKNTQTDQMMDRRSRYVLSYLMLSKRFARKNLQYLQEAKKYEKEFNFKTHISPVPTYQVKNTCGSKQMVMNTNYGMWMKNTQTDQMMDRRSRYVLSYLMLSYSATRQDAEFFPFHVTLCTGRVT